MNSRSNGIKNNNKDNVEFNIAGRLNYRNKSTQDELFWGFRTRTNSGKWSINMVGYALWDLRDFVFEKGSFIANFRSRENFAS